MLGIKWQPYYSISLDYVEELLFSGFQRNEVNTEFRNKYGQYLANHSGDENLCIAKINDEIGWGVFALRDIRRGELICRYGGEFVREGIIPRQGLIRLTENRSQAGSDLLRCL